MLDYSLVPFAVQFWLLGVLPIVLFLWLFFKFVAVLVAPLVRSVLTLFTRL